MDNILVGIIKSNNGVKYYVRYVYADNLLQLGTKETGPWFVIREHYQLDNNALDYAKEYADNSMV